MVVFAWENALATTVGPERAPSQVLILLHKPVLTNPLFGIKIRGAQMTVTPLDYGASFLIGTAPQNKVRFWVESRTRIINERNGMTEDYFQCASCKSEGHCMANGPPLVIGNMRRLADMLICRLARYAPLCGGRN